MLLVERRHGTYSITVIEGTAVSRGEHIVNHELSLLAAHPSRTKIYCPACTTHAAISYFIRDSANESYKLVSIGSGDDDDAGSKPTRDPCVAIRPAGFQR